jgi:hypothetical protein
MPVDWELIPTLDEDTGYVVDGLRHIVINTCFGGFELSEKAALLYTELGGKCTLEIDKSGYTTFVFGESAISRDEPALVNTVSQLGEEAAGGYSRLKIVQIPADVVWDIHEDDGAEHVMEKHRTWR